MKKICNAIGKHFIKPSLAAILLLTASLLFAQDLVIPKISSYWEPHTQYSMSAKRERLIAHLKAYDAKILDFNSRCGTIPTDNTSLISACKQESAILDKESDEIDREIEIYKADFDFTEKIYKAYKDQKENQAKQQKEIEAMMPGMIIEQKQLIQQRSPNQNAIGIINSYKNKVPPLPHKRFDELESGDVLLVAPDDMAGHAIRLGDWIGSLSTESKASHTVTYLKEINGQKFFLDNLPFEGPTIISEKQLDEKYRNRNMDVAKPAFLGVAEPLKPDEAEALFKAAVEMQAANLNSGNTNFGVRGDNDIVCSEASWALINSTNHKIPGTDFGIKSAFVNFSPADFYAQKQYFLVTPLKY